MRGKTSPATRVFESPYATDILPAKDAGRVSKRAATPAAEVAPPEPLAEAPVYIPTHGPVAAPAPAPVAIPAPAPAPAPAQAYAAPPPTPAYEPPAPVYAPPPPAFAAPVTDYPAHYPSAPGFPPQPPYAEAAQVAAPALSAPMAPPAPVGYPSASYQPTSQPAPYQPAPYQPAAYAPPPNPPSSYQPSRFEPQGFAASGYQTPGYAPPGYLPPAQAQPFQNFPPTSGRSAGAKVLIGLALVVGGFVVLGILAAIAIPVFLSQRAKPANRNIVLPSVLLDQQRLSSADLDASVAAEVASLQKHTPGGSQAQAAFYGQGGLPTFLVVAGKPGRRPTPADTKAFFSTQSGGELTFTPVANGPFGGTMECGPATANGVAATICGSVDDAGVVYILGFNTSPSQLAIVTREILGVIEQKG